MIETRVLERDDLTGEVELMHYDDQDGSFSIETITDHTLVMEVSKAAFNRTRRGEKHKDMTHIGMIPLEAYFAEQKKGTWDDPKAFSRFVNDSHSPIFRTRPGKY